MKKETQGSNDADTVDMIVIYINSLFHLTLKDRYGMIKETFQQEY